MMNKDIKNALCLTPLLTSLMSKSLDWRFCFPLLDIAFFNIDFLSIQVIVLAVESNVIGTSNSALWSWAIWGCHWTSKSNIKSKEQSIQKTVEDYSVYYYRVSYTIVPTFVLLISWPQKHLEVPYWKSFQQPFLCWF